MEYAIEINYLQKSYASNHVLKDISFSVIKGEIFAILGVNGAGKTTMLECLEGLRKYNAGTIKINGKYGIQLQSSSLPQNMKVNEAILLFAKWNHASIDHDYLIKLGVHPFMKKQYSELSIGQKRRLHLALALLGNPDIVFLDEPTAGLDVEGRIAIHSEIQSLKKKGKTIILTSHDMSEVEDLCDRIAILRNGTIAFCGTTTELTKTSQNHFILQVRFSKDLDVLNIKSSKRVEKVKEYYNFQTSNLENTLSEIITLCHSQNIKINDIRMDHIGLEQRFLEVAKEAL